MDAGGWTLSVLVTLFLIALVVAAIVWLIRNQDAGVTPRHRSDEGGSARELLDRRLVAGEIGEDEYQRLRTALSETPLRIEPPDQPAHVEH